MRKFHCLTLACILALLLGGCSAQNKPSTSEGEPAAASGTVEAELSQALAENLDIMVRERSHYGSLEELGISLEVGEVTVLGNHRYTYSLTLRDTSGSSCTLPMEDVYGFAIGNGYKPLVFQQSVGVVLFGQNELMVLDANQVRLQPLALGEEPTVLQAAVEGERIVDAAYDKSGGYLVLSQKETFEDNFFSQSSYHCRSYDSSGQLRQHTESTANFWIPDTLLDITSEFPEPLGQSAYLNGDLPAWKLGNYGIWLEGHAPVSLYNFDKVFSYDDEHRCMLYSNMGLAVADWGGEWKFLTFDSDLLLPGFTVTMGELQPHFALDPVGPVLKVWDDELEAVWDFGEGTVDIQYRYTAADVVGERPRAVSPAGRYAVYELSVGGAGDGGWGNFAVHDREMDTVKRMETSYLTQSLAFFGEETIVLDCDEPTLRTYDAATCQCTDLAPALPTNADGEPLWVLWMGADEARDCLLVLCREPGWMETDFDETAPMTLAVYGRDGTLLAAPTDVGEVHKQYKNWVYKPEVRMHDGALSVYDSWNEGEAIVIPYADALPGVK